MTSHTPPGPPPAVPLAAFTPVPRKCARHDGWTPERQRGFIEMLADTGSVRAAANSVGMTPESAYYLRRQPDAESFAAAWAAALDCGVKRIEDVAMERALHGVEVPVYSYGKLIGTRTVYNDRLLMFMLRNRAAERFTEGSARGLSALDKSRLAKMKAEWRAEWEKDRSAAQPSITDVKASILRKIEAIEKANQSRWPPRTRALHDAFCAAAAEDEANPAQSPKPD